MVFDVPSSPCDLPRGKEHVTSSDPPQKTFGAHPKWAQNYAYIKPFSNRTFISETATSTPESVVVSDLNYDCLGEIKYYYSHIIIQVLT